MPKKVFFISHHFSILFWKSNILMYQYTLHQCQQMCWYNHRIMYIPTYGPPMHRYHCSVQYSNSLVVVCRYPTVCRWIRLKLNHFEFTASSVIMFNICWFWSISNINSIKSCHFVKVISCWYTCSTHAPPLSCHIPSSLYDNNQYLLGYHIKEDQPT